MRIVVYPHVMEIGGSQLNAIELASAVQDLGHEVIVFGQPGPLLARVRELGLEFVESPPLGRRPSWRVMTALTRLARDRSVDLIHGYEWTTALESYAGPGTVLGLPVVVTVMSMAVAPFLPDDLSLIVGTEQIAAHEQARGRSDVHVIEPPVDTRSNRAEIPLPIEGFRRRFGLEADCPTVVCVTRLASELKLEGLLTAIDVVGDLASAKKIRLVVVGDGPARAVVTEHAGQANQRAGREVVVLTGELEDPRPAYAIADVCLGMGGSALRAMAFAKPLIVQGERGFWEVLDPATVEQFLWAGWYGIGPDAGHGFERLRDLLSDLLADPVRRNDLSGYGRSLVEDRFSLDRAGLRQLQIYEAALAGTTHRPRLVPAVTAAAGFAKYKVQRKLARRLGRGRSDDFNARPVAAGRMPRPGPVS